LQFFAGWTRRAIVQILVTHLGTSRCSAAENH